MSSDAIADRVDRVRARVDAACRAAGRDPASVRLIAVSKTRPEAEVREALRAGQLDLGENYAQELRDKARALAEQPEALAPRWHYIGHLQSNKVKYVAGVASLVHTVDSLRLGEELARRAPDGQAVLVQVNVGGEAQKSGVPAAEALALCARLAEVPGLEVRGLMTITPAVDEPEQARPYFRALAALAAEGRARGLPLVELSMGMSADYEVAIAEGATLVRVGTAIFGARG